MNKDLNTLYAHETRQSVQIIQEISQWIRENKETEGFTQKHAQILNRFKSILSKMPKLFIQEELLALKTKSVARRFPSNVLYDELRRYLLKNPL